MQRQIFLNYREVTLFQRVAAKAIDLLIAITGMLLLNNYFGWLGNVFAIFYLCFADGFSSQGSVGKYLLGLKVLDYEFGLSCDFKSSLIRNVPLLVFFMGGMTGVYWVQCLTIVPILFELYFLVQTESGTRFGDVMSRTQVKNCA